MLLLGVEVHRGGPGQVDHRDDHFSLGLESAQRNALHHSGLLLTVKNELGPESSDAVAALVSAATRIHEFKARLTDAIVEWRFASGNANLKINTRDCF